MTRRDFRTPSTVPESNITRCITIPANQEWLGLVNAAFLMLTEPWRYTQVFDTDLTPAETAAIAFDMYVAYLAGCEVDMNCSDVIACMLPYIQAQQIAGGVVRLDPVTEEPQVSYDGGVTWSDVPQSPQPVQTPTPTPTPGSDDAARICLASTRAALIIAEFYSQTFGAFTADLLNTLNGINQFLHSINTALYNLIYSPYEGILEAAGWFDFDFTTNYTAATLTTEQVEDITCLLIDNATVDGSGIVSFDHAAVQAALIAVLGVNPGTAVTLNVSNMRGEGLQAASQVNVTETADCDHCNEVWCYEWDMTSTDGSFTVVPSRASSYVASEGWSGGNWSLAEPPACDLNFRNQINIRRTFDASVITHVEMEFSGDNGFIQTAAALNNQINLFDDAAQVVNYVVNENFGTGVVQSWSGEATADRIELQLSIGQRCNSATGIASANFRLQRVLVRGIGSNPFGEDNC